MTEVAECTKLKSTKQNHTKAACQGLQWPLLPAKWPGAMTKAITVRAGTTIEGFDDGLCGCARGFAFQLCDPHLRAVSSPVRMAHLTLPKTSCSCSDLRTGHLSLAGPFQGRRHNDNIHISSQGSSNNPPCEHTQR